MTCFKNFSLCTLLVDCYFDFVEVVVDIFSRMQLIQLQYLLTSVDVWSCPLTKSIEAKARRNATRAKDVLKIIFLDFKFRFQALNLQHIFFGHKN
jgi:hypothetical protein